MTAGLTRKDGKIALEGLLAYEKAFQVEFHPEKLAQQEAYKEIFRTPEFIAWAKSRRK